jgi:2-oxoglutarate dehydrogenase complex dehydrogenase (E1) component-like enzyme
MPANYYHILRRQMHRDYRKPLVIAAPKIGLKHPKAYSSLSDFEEGTHFKPIISRDYGTTITKVIFCTGKVAFDIEARLEKNGATGYKVIRVEELAPFPVKQIREEL